MKTMKRHILTIVTLMFMTFPALALAATPTYSTVGVGGYDLVSYHTGEKPQRGNGNHVAVYEGVSYLFANAENKQRFAADPAKYLPAYGGYCAYGVAVGKKFISDPDVWEIVDGKLYLNLDNKIKGLWAKDMAGYIKKADAKWPRIKEKLPSEL